MKLSLANFAGEIPRSGDADLPENAAASAIDLKLFSGELRPWNEPSQVLGASLPSGFLTKYAAGKPIKSIYRMVNNSAEYWMNWSSNVDVCRSPVSGDTFQRFYYSGDNEPRMTTLNIATTPSGITDYPANCFVLGVFAPDAAATVAVTGGATPTETRVYVTTFVTQYGEESAPSPPVSFTGNSNGSWALSNMPVPPPNNGTISGATYASGIVTVTTNTTRGLRAGETITHASIAGSGNFAALLNSTFTIVSIVDTTHYTVALGSVPTGTYTSGGTWKRNAPHNTGTAGSPTTYMKRRIYRTVTGQSSSSYFFVAEQADATVTTFTDSVSNVVAVTQGTLQTVNWTMPPTDLSGFVELPNGCLAGFTKNQLRFSEPYQPHAWPSDYSYSVFWPIVGLGTLGAYVLVTTTGRPTVFVGTDPANMTPEKVDLDEPCVSKQGIITLPGAVIYPGQNGLVLFTYGSPSIYSAAIMSRDEYQAINPSSLRAVPYQGRYLAIYKTIDGSLGAFVTDGQTLIRLSIQATTIWFDVTTDSIYFVSSDGKVFLLDGDSVNSQVYVWRSKKFLLPYQTNMGAGKVFAAYEQLANTLQQEAAQAAILAYNAGILARTDGMQGITHGCMNEAMPNTFMVNGSLLKDSALQVESRYLQIRLIADGIAIWSQTLTDKKAFRFPAKRLYDEIQVEISGNVNVKKVEIAENISELRNV